MARPAEFKFRQTLFRYHQKVICSNSFLVHTAFDDCLKTIFKKWLVRDVVDKLRWKGWETTSFWLSRNLIY